MWLSELELRELERRYGLDGFARLVMTGSARERSGHKKASEVMRTLVLARRLPATVPAVNREAYAELGRVGNNVNQVAAAINRGLLDPLDRSVVTEVLAELASVRRALLGLRPTPLDQHAADVSERAARGLDFDFDF
ncbi:plasmid mobilization relaxosome protein MobC [Roseateles sp.]|uniref:plasmid mobilization relaxosome protein MobC n=1 Tax=Roseateles sp. TaxID=1971397 RepID=UPI0031DA957B